MIALGADRVALGMPQLYATMLISKGRRTSATSRCPDFSVAPDDHQR
jgi:hypothetical protein